MPIYEYRCGACGHQFEALQKMSDGALRKCPDCGKSQLRRLVSAPQFRLKGSGWYETDFKNKNETKRNLVENASSESSEGGSDKSKDKDKDTDTATKEAPGKAAPETKKDGADAKPAPSKPANAKPSEPPRRKSAAKSSPKAARS
jgi:putative FmdB family regulatory protein